MFFTTPPLIPLWVYDSFVWLIQGKRDTYPEYYVKKIAGTLGKKCYHEDYLFCRYVGAYDEYRSAASVSRPVAIWLWRYLQNMQPISIVEFGPGFSSIVFTAYARMIYETTQKKISVFSCEYDGAWCETYRRTLKQLGLSEWIDMIHVPLVKKNDSAMYDLTCDAAPVPGSVDCVFVDSPMGKRYGGPGREGAFKQALTLVRNEGTVLLHDALREEEYMLIHQCLAGKNSTLRCEGIVADVQGIAVVKKSPAGCDT